MEERIIMHTSEPGSGAALYVAGLVRALAGAGEAVSLFCPSNFAGRGELEQAGIPILCSGVRSTGAAGRFTRIFRNLRFLGSAFFRQLSITRSCDIVHFQFPLYFPAGLVFFFLAKLQARAIVYTAHDPVPHKWLLPPYLRRLERRMLACAYDLSDRIIVHSSSARDLLIREFAQSSVKIAIIPHGCSSRPYSDLPPDSGVLELLIFGSIREDKGLDLAIQAVQNINAHGLRVRLHIAGAVANAREQLYWDGCKQQVARRPLGILVDERFIPDECIADLLAQCHAVLLPYRNCESDSGVAAVAVASARAVIAPDGGSFAPLFNAAGLGFPIHASTVSGVEEAIRRALAAGRDELKETGLRGLAFARSRSWDAVGRQTARLYEELQTMPIHTVREPGMVEARIHTAPRTGPARKLLMVITSLGFGGADTQLVALARTLRSRGWEVTVVSMIAPTAHQDRLAAVGIPVHSLGMRRRVPDPRALFRFRRLLRRFQPDVVHSHMVHANLLARLTRCIAPVPVLVCTAHNTRESSERGGPTWHKELLYRLTDGLADQTTIVCEAGFEHYVKRKAVLAARLKVIPIGVDCELFAPDPEKRLRARLDLAIPDGHFVFLAMGRMVVQKDYPNLLRAAVLLRDRPWTLLIAGHGPLQSEIQRLSRELGLSGRVRFVGVNPDVRPWFLASDSFVMSSAVEGMPVVLLEAAASGLPAVVTSAGGSGEVVVSGKTGFVVPTNNDRALARAMERMLDMSPARRMQFAADARRRALSDFEIGQVVSRWETLYDSCFRRRLQPQAASQTASQAACLTAPEAPRTNG
jgi:glycosyltransferase involved in cell wall biosynthesis